MERPVCSGRSRLAGGRGRQPATFDLRPLLSLAARAAPSSASHAAGSPGDAEVDGRHSGATAAEPQPEEEERPAGVGLSRDIVVM